MKKSCLLLLSGALLLSACSSWRIGPAGSAPVPAAAPAPAPAPSYASDGSVRVGFDGVEIEKVPFRAGVSSATVERMARKAGCVGNVGAGLVSEAGPVEVYRLACDDGKVFLARCELRQCQPMP